MVEGIKKFAPEILASMFSRTLTQHVEADITETIRATPEEVDAAEGQWAGRLAALKGKTD